MLKRAPSLTEQVKAHIQDQIVNNAFPDGRIPPETELAEALGVSRTTVRDALSRLEMEGKVVRKQGAGTFVNEPVLQVRLRLEEIWSYEAMLEANGFTPATEVLDMQWVTAGAGALASSIVSDLGLAPDERVLVVTKLFLENEVPVILTRNHLPERILSDGYSEADLCQPVYEFLDTFGRAQLSYYLSEIVPEIASGDIVDALQVPVGTPQIRLEETGYNETNEPILKSHSYLRDDLLRLRLLRRRV